MNDINLGNSISTHKKNLVICRAGDNSLHKEWLNPGEKVNFDLMISYYGNSPGLFKDDCMTYEEKKGPFYIPVQKFILRNLGLVLQYDAIWLPDDDLSINATDINTMFDIFHAYNLWLAQPSVALDSYYIHRITIQNKQCLLRYTNFVEVMAPIFSRDTLIKCLYTFEKSVSSWGLDDIWPCILGYPEDKIAIIDSIAIRHTKPFATGELYKNLKISPHQEADLLASEYNVKLPYEMRTYKEIYHE